VINFWNHRSLFHQGRARKLDKVVMLLHLFSGGVQFESRLGNHLYCLRFSAVF